MAFRETRELTLPLPLISFPLRRRRHCGSPEQVRLAWHASGTYDKHTHTGGSEGATMRFAPESEHGANAGLHTARDFLKPIKAKFPDISCVVAGVRRRCAHALAIAC